MEAAKLRGDGDAGFMGISGWRDLAEEERTPAGGEETVRSEWRLRGSAGQRQPGAAAARASGIVERCRFVNAAGADDSYSQVRVVSWRRGAVWFGFETRPPSSSTTRHHKGSTATRRDDKRQHEKTRRMRVQVEADTAAPAR
jgi:hypothetical protein